MSRSRGYGDDNPYSVGTTPTEFGGGAANDPRMPSGLMRPMAEQDRRQALRSSMASDSPLPPGVPSGIRVG